MQEIVPNVPLSIPVPESVQPGDEPTESGTGTPAQEAPVQSLTGMDALLAQDTEQGMLRVQAFRGRQAIPVEGVRVTVSCPLEGGDVTLFEGVTNESGLIDSIILPAPAASQSLSPGEPSPSATYNMTATIPGYQPFQGTVKIFPGVKTVQPIQLQLQEG